MTHPTDGTCVFCKIVAGQLPCFKLLEDDHTIAFMDSNPVNPGHALAVAKGHWPTIDVIPPDVIGAVAQTAQKVHSKLQMRASSECGGRSLSQYSQFGRSCSAMVVVPASFPPATR